MVLRQRLEGVVLTEAPQTHLSAMPKQGPA